ncbi:MAG: hypothetical protein AAGC80_04625 [Rhodococcus sp. (in: high G+C Gram-positive bacteria)]
MDDREEHDLDVVRSRLIQRYPDLDSAVLENLIVALLGRFDGCRVRDFVPLLVERAATRTLDTNYSRAPARPAPMPPADVPTTAHIEAVVPAASSIRGVRQVLVRRSPRLS